MKRNNIPTKNKAVIAWVEQVASLCEPNEIYWCNGSDEEYARLCNELVEKGTFIKLNELIRLKSFFIAIIF